MSRHTPDEWRRTSRRLFGGNGDDWTLAKAHLAAGLLNTGKYASADPLATMSPVRRRIELRRRANAGYYAACDNP